MVLFGGEFEGKTKHAMRLEIKIKMVKINVKLAVVFE